MNPIVIDLETEDPHLKERGTDAYTRRYGGRVFMVGLFLPGKSAPETLPWNGETKARLRRIFDEGGHTWIGANLKYDLAWLLSEEVLLPEHTLRNRFRDVLIDAPLLDETLPPGHYSLDGQCQFYGLQTKPVEKLLAAAASVGVKCTEKTVRGKLHLLPTEVVADYLVHDLVSTWAVFEKQAPLLQSNKLDRVSELESLLLPVLSLMEFQGVRVDVKAAENLYEQASEFIDGVSDSLKRENGGVYVPLTTSSALTNFVRSRGHVLTETPKSAEKRKEKELGEEKARYTLDDKALKKCGEIDPLIASLLDARKAEKIAKDFVKGGVLAFQRNGRVHANINQVFNTAGGETGGGVRVGRMSYSKPNLQQIPKKDKISLEGLGGLGSAMRRIFIAEDGYEFMSADFSSQEPRWIIHWCEVWKRPGAEKIADLYRKDPTISSHDIVASGIEGDLPYKQKRDLAKVINLGKGYNMGKAKLILNLVAAGVDPSQADKILADFDRNFPHVKAGSDVAMQAAEQNGYVRTHMGRKLHFNDFEPVVFRAGPPLPYDLAFERYVVGKRMPIRRADTYRAFNRIIQGSSADQTKQAMVDLWYKHRIIPTLQIHDELTDARSTPERRAIFKETMETAILLTIPNLTECKIGPNWSDAELFIC